MEMDTKTALGILVIVLICAVILYNKPKPVIKTVPVPQRSAPMPEKIDYPDSDVFELSSATQVAYWVADGGEKCIIFLNGEINHTTEQFVIQAMDILKTKSCASPRLTLNSQGGAVDSAMRISTEVRKRGYSTQIFIDSSCESACVLAFAGGVHRTVWPSSKLGVHQIRNGFYDGRCNTTEASNQPIKEHLSKMLGEEAANFLYTAQMRTDCNDMKFFNAQTLLLHNIANEILAQN